MNSMKLVALGSLAILAACSLKPTDQYTVGESEPIDSKLKEVFGD